MRYLQVEEGKMIRYQYADKHDQPLLSRLERHGIQDPAGVFQAGYR